MKQIKIDVRCDQGAYTGVVSISDVELLLPSPIGRGGFLQVRKGLSSGFNEVQAKPWSLDSLYLPGGSTVEEVRKEVMRRITTNVNMYLIGQDGTGGEGEGEILLSGTIRKGNAEERALVTIVFDDKELKFRINCDDVVLCTSLQEGFKKLLSNRS